MHWGWNETIPSENIMGSICQKMKRKRMRYPQIDVELDELKKAAEQMGNILRF